MDSPAVPATRLEQELASRERSISWLARKAGIHPTYAWKMVRGLRPVTDDFKAAAERELGVSVAELFADIAPEEPAQAAS